ncbi:P22 phage major capsid protein family protein [Shigella flexneri]
MAQKTTKYSPPADLCRRFRNTVWMPVEQEAPTRSGWDLTATQTGVLEL